MAEEYEDYDSEDEENEGAQTSTVSKKKLLWLLLPIFSVVAIVIGLYFSGMADSLLAVSKTEETKEAVTEKKTSETSAIFFDVPELLINLSVKPGQKPIYVKIRVALEMAAAAEAEQAEKMLPRIIDSLQFYLREMRMEEIQGSSGSYRLKEEIQGRLNRILAPARVVDVLFKEFLIQ